MILGKVVGNVVSTVKCPDYNAYKLLLVQSVDQAGTPKGRLVLAIDAVQAGIGDTVIVIDEGGSARVVLDTPDIRSIRTVIVGIVDEVDTGVSNDVGTSNDARASSDTGASNDAKASNDTGASSNVKTSSDALASTKSRQKRRSKTKKKPKQEHQSGKQRPQKRHSNRE